MPGKCKTYGRKTLTAESVRDRARRNAFAFAQCLNEYC